MKGLMMDFQLTLPTILKRAETYFPHQQIVTRMPDRSFHTYTFADLGRRSRQLAVALQNLGLERGDRVATLCWNHYQHLEAYLGIPCGGLVLHTLNLRLAPDELGWIAGDAEDRFLIVDDVLLPLYRQFAAAHRFEKVIVFPFSGATVEAGFTDGEADLWHGRFGTHLAAVRFEKNGGRRLSVYARLADRVDRFRI